MVITALFRDLGDLSHKKNIFLWSIVAGALLALGLPPINFMPACFLGFGLFTYSLGKIFALKKHHKYQKIALFAFAHWGFGLAYFLSGLYWLGYAMKIMGELPSWLVLLLTFALPALLALFWAGSGAVLFFLWRNNFSRFFALALCFGVSEWLRGHLFSGFPWNAIGYNLMPNALFMQTASLLGLYGINFFAVLLFSLAAGLIAKKERYLAASLIFIIFLMHLTIGIYFLAQAAPIGQNPHLKADGSAFTVRLLQPSVSPAEKFAPHKLQKNFMKQMELATKPPLPKHKAPDLIIWPETALPFILSYYPEIVDTISTALLPHQIALLGTVRAEGHNMKKQFYNSLEAYNAHGNLVAVSDKLHLVPFGEYLPFRKLLEKMGFSKFLEAASEYHPAPVRKTVVLPNGLIYLPLICYEIIFPDEMNYEGPEPQFIINVTNDMWYGDSPGPYQHLQQAKLRAVEQRLPVLRAANNGISAVIDPYGREVSSLSLNDINTVDSVLPSKITNTKSFLPGNFVFLTVFIVFIICYCIVQFNKNCP